MTATSIFWDFWEDYEELGFGEYEESIKWPQAKEKWMNERFRPHLNRMLFMIGSVATKRNR